MCIRDSDSCEQFSIPAAAKNPELAKEFLRFLYSDESVSAFAEASGALYATKSAREVAKDKLSTAIYNMYGIYEEANASSLIMSFAAVPADCKVNQMCIRDRKKAVLKTVKAGKSGTATVTIGKAGGKVSGYAIQVSTDSSFKKVTTYRTAKTTYTLKNLSKGKTYYVRVKAFTKISDKNVYGAASKTIKVKAK